MAQNQAQSLVGRQVGPYKIHSLLGVGGMGEVYLAQDPRLDRDIALKILPAELASDPDRIRRFIREARAASGLKHPNVATIYEIGKSDEFHFIAMEYVEGQTLASKINGRPLPIAEIVDIGIQVADALDEAHRKGITHRDIKPANLMLTSREQVKILDFGLAKVTQPEGQALGSDISTVMKTETGVVMGTMHYMSPEQVLGKEVDHRTDIFSLGVVLYEMATGRLPFTGTSSSETMDRVLHGQPEAIARFNYDLPVELERIVRKCLAKDRGWRYQSARELLIDLRELRRDSDTLSPSAGQTLSARQKRVPRHIDSLAILPLGTAGGDPDTEYLGDGISESLINRLSQLPKLRVVPRSKAFRYKGRDIESQAVGRELDVRAVLTGRVLQRGNTLEVQVDLVDTAKECQIWGYHCHRELSDILTVRDEIVEETAEKLQLKLTGEEKRHLTKRYTDSTEAFQLYLRGRYHWNQRTPDGFKKGIEYFQQAIEKDPSYALAYSGLADCYQLLSVYIVLRPKDAFPKAKAAALKAIQIDDKLAEAHASLGFAREFYDWDCQEAERELRRAIELNPGYAPAHQWYGFCFAMQGRLNESKAELKQALRLEPLSLSINMSAGWPYYFAHEYELAIQHFGLALEMKPDYQLALYFLALACEQRGDSTEAVAAFNKAGLLGEEPDRLLALAHVAALANDRVEVDRLVGILEELSKQRFVSPFRIATIYAGLGDKEQAFEWLERAVEERSPWLAYVRVEPKLDTLRSDPRFNDVLKKMELKRREQ